MKKTVLILSFLACALMSSAESRVWVSPLEIMPGEHSYLRVNYEFNEGHSICNYQMKVVLPEGVTVDGTDVVLGNCHTSHTGSIVNNVLVVTSMNTVLQGTSGVLVEIPVVANNNLTEGTQLKGNLENVKLGQTNETSINSTDIAFDVDIVDYILLDENSITPFPSSSTVKKVMVRRTIKADEWSTLCLPFTLTETQLKTIMGNDVQLAYFDSYEVTQNGDNVTGILVKFKNYPNLSTNGFVKNRPCLIKTSKDITEFSVEVAVDRKSAMVSYRDPDDEDEILGQLIGTYQAETVVPEKSLFLSGNKLYYSSGKTKMKAFRAYFSFQDVLAEMNTASARIMLSVGGDATGIRLDGQSTISSGVYDLQGRRVEKPAKKGLYVRSGKKVIVK